MEAPERLSACHCCGLIQRLPELSPDALAACCRCGTVVLDPVRRKKFAVRTISAAAAGLILFPFAVSMPVMSIEKLGHAKEASIWSGAIDLLQQGDWAIGLVVIVCSILLPCGKLLCLLGITLGSRRISRQRRAATYRVIEWTGRWGMLDVLLIALVVAWVKLGDLVQVSAGPAALAFTLVVVFSLLASAWFDPHAIWQEDLYSEGDPQA